MQQDKALKILSANIKHIKHNFGITSIGVFPWDAHPPNPSNTHPKIGIAVNYQPHAQPGFIRFIELKHHIEELLGCEITLIMPEGLKDNWTNNILKETTYAS